MSNIAETTRDSRPSPGPFRLRDWLRKAHRKIASWRQILRDQHSLATLNDAQLHDIGLTRQDLPISLEDLPSARHLPRL